MCSPAALHEAVCALQIELVLTAHPTEVSRRTLIHKHNRVAALLAEGDRPDLTVPERADLQAALRREILSAWTTDEVRHQRLTPIDEVKSGLIVFEQSLWDALPRFLRSVDRALTSVTGQPVAARRLAGALRVVDWRRSRRQPERDARRHETGGAARPMGGRRSLSERSGSAPRRALDDPGDRPRCGRSVGDAREPYRELLRQVRNALVDTRAWIESCLDSGSGSGSGSGDPDRSFLETSAAGRDRCSLLHVARRNRKRADRRRPVDRRLETRRGIRRHARAARHSAGVRSPYRSARRHHTRARTGLVRGVGRDAQRLEFLIRELPNPRPLVPTGLTTSPAVARRARHVPNDRRHARRIARQLHRHDDPPRLGRARRRVAAERDGRRSARCASCRCSRRPPISVAPRRSSTSCSRSTGIARESTVCRK